MKKDLAEYLQGIYQNICKLQNEKIYENKRMRGYIDGQKELILIISQFDRDLVLPEEIEEKCWRKYGCPFNSNNSWQYMKCLQESYSVEKCKKEHKKEWDVIDKEKYKK